MGKTLFDKVWDAHTVRQLDGGRSVLYIDRHYIHEVTSPVAFLGLRNRGIKVARPDRTTGTPDHNVPTVDQDKPVAEEQSRMQLESFGRNCEANGVEYFKLGSPRHGVVHIVGPELGITQPGMTIVCGDSHTSTHGAFGAVAFGIGTSEVEMVFASQCILQPKPKTMRITVDGRRGPGVTAKDIVLYVISRISASGGTGHFIEFAGEAIRALSMEERMTFSKALAYMDFRSGEPMLGKRVDYVFLGSCTNGRIEDFRQFAHAVKGRRKAPHVTAWLVPGSKGVEAQARAEGLDKILAEAGFELRQPGCSACLAMNADKIPAGMYSVSTSNRNFEGRQGPGARTMLAGPLVAAAAAVTGCVSDPREVFGL